MTARKYQKKPCPDCGKLIHIGSKRCRSCAMKFLFKDPRNHPMYGADRTGNKNSFYGKHHTEETKKKISKTKLGVPVHTQKHKDYLKTLRGKKSYSYCNGEYIHSGGYVGVLQDDGSYKLRHRIIAEKVLGRPLKPSEIVHHFDGDKQNNSNDNLLICSQAYHAWLHGMQKERDCKGRFI